MYATCPPSENQLATRAAVVDLARAKLAPLFPIAADLDALPAWLWSLPTQTIARSLSLDAPLCAAELARKVEAETAVRHPADRYVAHLAAHHPLLSHVQRARLADFAQAFCEARQRSPFGEVTTRDMERRGFTFAECERLTPRAHELMRAVEAAEAQPDATAPTDPTPPAERLRAAGELSHVRRAYAEGDLELGPAEAARVRDTAEAAQPELEEVA